MDKEIIKSMDKGMEKSMDKNMDKSMDKSMDKDIIKNLLQYRSYTLVDQNDNKLIAQKQGQFILVIFSSYPTLNIEGMKEYLSMLDALSFTHMIIVYHKSITPSARKIVETIAVKNIIIEPFKSENLVDITKHRLFRIHEKITGDEETEIREKYGKKLPKILTNDAVARWYGFRKGNIIKIIRKHGHVAYRLVN